MWIPLVATQPTLQLINKNIYNNSLVLVGNNETCCCKPGRLLHCKLSISVLVKGHLKKISSMFIGGDFGGGAAPVRGGIFHLVLWNNDIFPMCPLSLLVAAGLKLVCHKNANKRSYFRRHDTWHLPVVYSVYKFNQRRHPEAQLLPTSRPNQIFPHVSAPLTNVIFQQHVVLKESAPPPHTPTRCRISSSKSRSLCSAGESPLRNWSTKLSN